jgi:uncharacterized protein YjbJ (UPF0337 family)
MNSDEMRGKWNQFKGSVKQKWGKLTDDDLTQIEGDRDRLIGKIQERYGITRENAQQELDNWKVPSGNVQDEEQQKRRAS